MRKFRPHVLYNEDGDCIEAVFSNEPYYAEWLSSYLTLYIGRESRNVVGVLITDVRRIMRDESVSMLDAPSNRNDGAT